MNAMTARKECPEIRGECAEHLLALEQRIERSEERQDSAERDMEGMWTVLTKIGEDVSYLRGRFDAMASGSITGSHPIPPPAPKRSRSGKMAINLGLGGAGLVALVDLLKHLLSH